HGVFGDALVGLVVDADARRPEDPRRLLLLVTARATRIGRVQSDGALVVDELDAPRLAAGAGTCEAIGRGLEETFEAFDLQLQLRPREDVAVTADDDMSARPGLIVSLVVGQAIGANDDRAAPEFDVADGFGVEVGAAVDFPGAQDDGKLSARLAARRRLQGGRLAQFDARGRTRRCAGRGRRARLGEAGLRTSDRQDEDDRLQQRARGPAPYRPALNRACRLNPESLASGLTHEATAERGLKRQEARSRLPRADAAGRGRCRPAERAGIDL